MNNHRLKPEGKVAQAICRIADCFEDTAREAAIRDKIGHTRPNPRKRAILRALFAQQKLMRRAMATAILWAIVTTVQVEITFRLWLRNNNSEAIPLAPDFILVANAIGVLYMLLGWGEATKVMKRVRTMGWALITTGTAITIRYLTLGY